MEVICKRFKQIAQKYGDFLWMPHLKRLGVNDNIHCKRSMASYWSWNRLKETVSQTSAFEVHPSNQPITGHNTTVLGSFSADGSRCYETRQCIDPQELIVFERRSQTIYKSHLEMDSLASVEHSLVNERTIELGVVPWPAVFWSQQSNFYCVNLGAGYVQLWDTQLQSIHTFRAWRGRCQARLYRDLMVCFDIDWQGIEGRRACLWDLSDPKKPKQRWNLVLDAYIVDIDLNSNFLVLASDMMSDEAGSGAFGVEVRALEDGRLIKRLSCLNGLTSVVKVTLSHFHIVLPRSTPDCIQFVVCSVLDDRIVHEMDSRLWGTTCFGGIQMSNDESIFFLWADKKIIALDLQSRRTLIFQKQESEFDRYFGYWAVAIDSKRHLTVSWRPVRLVPSDHA
ncbi:hypothetical protein EDD86DRAFT_203088 [Gorgonomyces haynaldii]|nr:hypothetical protein EDD86DRAFT_203088 [Gorgonomyces haynaldii]